MIRRFIDEMRTGDALAAMEAAKRLIGSEEEDYAALLPLAEDRSAKAHSRIAAIYALGFAPKPGRAGKSLIRILEDETEDDGVRDHAAEALGHLSVKEAVPVLRRILASKVAEPLRRSCQFALDAMG